MHPRTRRGGGGTAELPSRPAAQQPGVHGVLDASVEVSSAKVSTAAQPAIAAAGGGVGRVDMSVEVGGGPGTRQIVTNYVDLANPHNLMPHLQQGETKELVDLVHQAFEAAQEACFYEFQPDNVRNQEEHVVMLLANITLRQHSVWNDNSHTIARLLRKETLTTYSEWCDKMDVHHSNGFLSPHRASQVVVQRIGWERLADGAPEGGNAGVPFGHVTPEEIERRRADPEDDPRHRKDQRMQLTRDLLADTALWWLVYGEAANLRFTPELLCYVYLHIVQVHTAASDAQQRGDPEPTVSYPFAQPKVKYLEACVQDVFNFLKAQASLKDLSGTLKDTSEKVNYSDANEFFWSKSCRQKVQGQLKDPEKTLKLASRNTEHTVGKEIAKWLTPSKGGAFCESQAGKSYKEYRGMVQIIKTHSRVLVFYFSMLFFLVSIALTTPFAQDLIPEEYDDRFGNASRTTRETYLMKHPEVFKCGLNYTDPRAARDDVCCLLDLFNAEEQHYSPETGMLIERNDSSMAFDKYNNKSHGVSGAWKIVIDADRCKRTPWIHNRGPWNDPHMDIGYLGFAIGLLQLVRVIIFLATDFHHSPRRRALIINFLVQLVICAVLFMAGAVQTEWGRSFKFLDKEPLIKIKSLLPTIGRWVNLGYSTMYLLTEILPPFHAIQVPWCSIHSGSAWLKFAQGALAVDLSDRGRLGETLMGWFYWIVTLALKAMFSYQAEVRFTLKHVATFWDAAHCVRTSHVGWPEKGWLCSSYSIKDANVTLDFDSNSNARDVNYYIRQTCDMQCYYIIHREAFKWMLIIILCIPNVIVFIVDTQIIFTVTQTFIGVSAGLSRRVASLKTFDDLRSRFKYLEARFESSISTYRGNFGENPIAEESLGLGQWQTQTFFPAPRMTTFRACWDSMIGALHEEDEMSFAEEFLFKYPPPVCDEAIPGVAESNLPNQRAQCFGIVPLFLLVGSLEECNLMIGRMQQMLGIRKDTGTREKYMRLMFKDARNHPTIPTALSTTWKLAIRLVEIILKLFKHERKESLAGINLTARNAGIDGIGYWLPNLMDELLCDYKSDAAMRQRQSGTEDETLTKFIAEGKFDKVIKDLTGLIKPLMDARLLDHNDKMVVAGVEQMRFQSGCKYTTTVDKGVNVLCVTAREVQAKLKALANTIAPVLSGSGGEDYGWNELHATVKEFSESSNEELVMDVVKHLLRGQMESHSVVPSLYHLLVTTEMSAVPKSEDVNRRLLLWAGSLQMEMPLATRVDQMHDFSTLVPFYNESVILTKKDLLKKNKNGMSIVLYIRSVYEHQWNNFGERVGGSEHNADDMWSDPHNELALRLWVSNRQQTLARCIRGMMRHEDAIRDLARMEGHSEKQAILLARQKFCLVVSCQIYGNYKKSFEAAQKDYNNHGLVGEADTKNTDDISRFEAINEMMKIFEHLRIAYMDNQSGTWFSVLVRWDRDAGQVVEVYRIKLPGFPIAVGEGKPENQNHAIIFTRGRYIQTVDMNQDGYYEESLKVRNLLEEFNRGRSEGCFGRDNKRVTIVGFSEHQFSGAFSAAAEFSALSEYTFTTLVQRMMEEWLDVRMHYGHPDIHDRLWLMTRGGLSKSNKVLCINEDIFGAYETMLRGGRVTYKEYMTCGKGKDLGFLEVSAFEAKIACGNAEQALSRDMSRINESMGLFRVLSFFHTANGFHINNVLVVWTTLWFVYSNILLTVFVPTGQAWAMVTLERDLIFLAQLGAIQTIPLMAEMLVQKGILGCLRTAARLLLFGGPVFYLFHTGTRYYYYMLTVDLGGAKYRATGRGLITEHQSFLKNFQQFDRSHFMLGMELMSALLVMSLVDRSGEYGVVFIWCWLFCATLLWAPFLYNFQGLDYTCVQADFWEWWDFMKGGWFGRMAGWGEWHEQSIALYKGCCLSLILRNSLQLIIPLALAFKYFEFFFLEYNAVPVNVVVICVMLGLGFLHCLVQVAQSKSLRPSHTSEIIWAWIWVFVVIALAVLLVISGLVMENYAISMQFVAVLPVVFGYMLAWATNTCFLLGARWNWITRMYWVMDLVTGLVIFTPLFIISIFRVCDSVHMRLLYNSKVLDILERAKAQKTIEHDLPMRRKSSAGLVRQRSPSQSPLDPSPLIPSPAGTRRGGVQ